MGAAVTPFYVSLYTSLTRLTGPTGGDVVVFERSGEAYPSVAALEQDFADIRACTRPLSIHRLGLLIDLTAVKGRNDAGFEHAMAPHRAWMFRSFGAVALVVRTEIGRLQVQRHLREDGYTHPVFLTRDESASWLARTLEGGSSGAAP